MFCNDMTTCRVLLTREASVSRAGHRAMEHHLGGSDTAWPRAPIRSLFKHKLSGMAQGSKYTKTTFVRSKIPKAWKVSPRK